MGTSNQFFKITLCFFLSLSLDTFGFAQGDDDVVATAVIEYTAKSKFSKKERKSIRRAKTHRTPERKKKGRRGVLGAPIYSPLRKRVIKGVTLEKEQKKSLSIVLQKRKRDESESETNLYKIEEPKKQVQYTVLDSTQNSFSGPMVFADPWNPDTNVYFDGSESGWGELATKFHLENNLKSSENLIQQALFFVKNNLESFVKNSIFRQEPNLGLVCRHYATFVLPFMELVLNEANFKVSGDIYQLTIATLNSDWKDEDDPHVFNVLSLKDSSGTNQWFVDFYNGIYTRLDAKEAQIFTLNHIGDGFENLSIEEFPNIAVWIEAAKDRVGLPTPRSLFHNSDIRNLIAEKVMLQYPFNFDEGTHFEVFREAKRRKL